MVNYLAIGLVVKGGEQFIDKWIESADKIGDIFLIVDNGADNIVKQKLINHPKTKHYLIQKDMGRNQSRDYQKILEMAKEEDIKWIWNLDIDECVPIFNKQTFIEYLLNTQDECIGFPLFEMRDNNHYVMVKDCTEILKHARCCHKCYKVLSHFKFNEKDWHGSSIPHNCRPGSIVHIYVQHFGHSTKELREQKRNQYKDSTYKDLHELEQSWLEEDESKITIKEWNDNIFK
jgi:hypothetical protein